MFAKMLYNLLGDNVHVGESGLSRDRLGNAGATHVSVGRGGVTGQKELKLRYTQLHPKCCIPFGSLPTMSAVARNDAQLELTMVCKSSSTEDKSS